MGELEAAGLAGITIEDTDLPAPFTGEVLQGEALLARLRLDEDLAALALI